LAVNIAEHVAFNEGLPVAVFSMEMGASQLAVRIVGSIGRIDQGHLRTGKLSDEEWPRLTEAIEKLRNVSLHIDETPGLTSSELRANARRLARQCGKLGLIVVDYLQLMSGSSSSMAMKPRHRSGRDLAWPQDAGQGASVSGDCAVAAQPQG
jgi:replicative DNA helicase